MPPALDKANQQLPIPLLGTVPSDTDLMDIEFSGRRLVELGDDLKEYYAKMSEGMEEVIHHLIENLINFVQSREYVRIAKKFDKKVNGENSPQELSP